MKMSDTEKTEGFAADDTLPECPAQGGSAASVRRVPEKALKTETTSSAPGEKDGDSPLQTEGDPSLLSMPCLMKELRRDSPESLHASTGSDKPTSGHVYESDSSNPCMLSPSSSGHLADSDTLSSGEEGCTPRAAGEARSAEAGADTGLATGGQMSASSGRKSRRSRSESEMSTSTMAAKKNRCQLAPAAAAVVVGGGGGASGEKQTNGRLAKVKGHRSQKHKERIRLLRQKREAAARKKYNLLQDSSTSDSDLTCDSSTSSSEDEDEATGGKTIPTDIPGHMEAELAHREPPQHKAHIKIPSSDSEVEIVGVQENTRCAHPRGGVIQSLSSARKPNSVEQFNSSTRPSSQHWTTVSPQPNWASPPEVVDLTLDDDARHKYLL
uniref:E3 ubiquitin-protein ligase Arkadia N-terminal domain-containing protein n=2 Tax=Esox lucius TaxID=8010 RepID=A0A3P8ZE14_ESOLU